MPEFLMFKKPKKIIEFPTGRILSESDLPQQEPQQPQSTLPEPMKAEIQELKMKQTPLSKVLKAVETFAEQAGLDMDKATQEAIEIYNKTL